MFIFKQNIITELNKIYIDYTFNKEYKVEFKNRILNFFNFKIEEKINSLTWQELKIFLNENIVFKKDIEKISLVFFNENKEELLNLFNPIWMKKKKLSKNKQQEIFELKALNLIEESIYNFPFLDSISKYHFSNHFYLYFKKNSISIYNIETKLYKRRKIKENLGALNFHGKLNVDKTIYLKLLENFKLSFIDSLSIKDLPHIYWNRMKIKENKISEYTILSTWINDCEYTMMNNELDFFNKKLIFNDIEFELDESNESYIYINDILNKIDDLTEKIKRIGDIECLD